MSKSMMRAPGGTCHHDEIEPPVGGIVHEVSCAHASVVLCMYHDDKASAHSLCHAAPLMAAWRMGSSRPASGIEWPYRASCRSHSPRAPYVI